MQANDKAIKALMECAWGGDYPSDDVARFFETANEEIGKLFQQVAKLSERVPDLAGFERCVDEDHGLAWVLANCPHLMTSNINRMSPRRQLGMCAGQV